MLKISVFRHINTKFHVLTSIPKRKLSTTFGYECASLINGDFDPMFFEKSIRKGCTMVLGKSGEHSQQVYELLYDLSDDESFDISKFTIGHVLKVPPKQSGQQLTADSFLVSEWKENLDNVRRKLVQRERALDFVTIQLPLMQHLAKTEDIKSLLTEFEEHFAENPVENRSGLPITPAVTRLGLDFDSNFFVGSPGLEVDKLIAILQPLADSRQLGALTVASNCLTYPHSHALLQWGKKQGIQTVSTEVTRVHHTRPGVLPANFQHASLHKPVDTPKKETFVGSSNVIDREQRCVQEIVEAVEDFKMAMDRCIGMEKKFLEELVPKYPRAAKVDPTTVCLAHVLSKSHSQVLYADEWSFLMTKQIEPKFNDSCSRLMSMGQGVSDWVLLYKTMVKYLLSSFRNLLQVRTLLVSQNTQDIIERHFPHLKSPIGVEGITQQMALLAAGTFGADFVTVAFSLVDSDEWQNKWKTQFAEEVKRPEFKENVTNVYKEINTVLYDYNNVK